MRTAFNKISAATVLAVACSAMSVVAHAQGAAPVGSADAGKTKISMCIGCHGIPEYKTVYPDVYKVPKIGGQSPQYIVAALKAYRAGDRNHPSMRGIGAQLSDQDMADLAAYYGKNDGGSAK